MARPLIHPRKMAALAAFYPERATVEAESAEYSATGQKKGSGWAAVAGMVELPCEILPLIEIRGGWEKAGEASTEAVSTHRIAFQGTHPITPRHRLRVASGLHAGLYDIQIVSADGVGLQTLANASKVE